MCRGMCSMENRGCRDLEKRGRRIAQARGRRLMPKLERVRGIEPPSEAWEAPALPLSYTRAATHLRGSAAAGKPLVVRDRVAVPVPLGRFSIKSHDCSSPPRKCFVSEDWRYGTRLWQAGCFLRERLVPVTAQLVPVVHRRDPRGCDATATSLAARRVGGPCGPTGASVSRPQPRHRKPTRGSAS
jgi:hypothetical protein